jgi:hypothetical protein
VRLLYFSIFICGFVMFNSGCSTSDSPEPVDCNLSDLAIEATGLNPTGCSINDGSIMASATGGDEPYKFALNSGSFVSLSTFSNLSGGNYTVRVKDKNGCEASVQVVLQIPGDNPLNATTTSTADTECLDNNGTIEITASGGTAPYKYKLGTDPFGDNPVFSNLPPGNYSIAVRDFADCVFTKGVTVTKGDSQTSLSGDVEPIIDTKCAITGCHNGSKSPNLTSTQSIIENASRIKSVTQSGQMPESGSSAGPLSAAQKALIACWVDEGAKNN